MQPNIAAAKAALAHIEQDENPATIPPKAGISSGIRRS
jgi:hypothetical protein